MRNKAKNTFLQSTPYFSASTSCPNLLPRPPDGHRGTGNGGSDWSVMLCPCCSLMVALCLVHYGLLRGQTWRYTFCGAHQVHELGLHLHRTLLGYWNFCSTPRTSPTLLLHLPWYLQGCSCHTSHSSLPAAVALQFFLVFSLVSQSCTQHHSQLSSGGSNSFLEQLELALV